ncbi:hypothetical protein ABW20_dc0106193 [Dactylellina cionopaga]|nr:hypothetical protein ABW20_dc0106193 [Dactylellina cionopaga]
MANENDIKPFKIEIPDEQLELLRKKLDLTTFPDEILEDENDWSQGPPLSTMRRLVKYWLTRYDWRKAESTLNLIPQFITPVEIDGFGPLNVHFLHVNKGAKNAIPLVMIHGWPGSFYELTKILGVLTQKSEGPVFE